MADILYSIGFQLEDKKLTNSLASIRQDIEKAFDRPIHLEDDIDKARDSISQAVVEAKSLEKAMKRATTDKGISYYSLQAELRKCGTSAAQLTANLAAGGESFRASLNAANVALSTSNRNVLALSLKIKEMGRVVVQSFKFTTAQSAIRWVTKSAQQAVGWVKSLNEAVNAIGVVTGKSADKLEKVTEASIVGAKNLRIAADEYAKAALIFYQQGLGDEEVAQRTEITIKAAKAAGVAVDEMSQQLTAIWNTYGMIGEEQANAASVGAKLAAGTAADFADIAEAMQISASAAAQMGVSYNSLAAMIATVKDTTQQSATIIGNAYKTIFSRFEQLKSAGTDGEVTLNRVSQQLAEMGVRVLDSSGELRELDGVITELGNNWGNYTQKQQLAIAETVGGTRQYGQLLALMQNFDKYQKNLGIANAETGADALEQQYSQAMDSITEKVSRAGESWKRAFGQLISEDYLKAVYDASDYTAKVVENILKGVGGLPGILNTVAALMSRKIAPQLGVMAENAVVGISNLVGGQAGRDKNIDKDYDRQAQNIAFREESTKIDAEKESLAIQKQKLEVNRQTAHVINQIDTLEKKATGSYKIKLESLRQQSTESLKFYQTSLDNLAAMKKQTEEQEKQLNLRRQEVADQRFALELRLQEAQQFKQTAEQEAIQAEQKYEVSLAKDQLERDRGKRKTNRPSKATNQARSEWETAKTEVQQYTAAIEEAQERLKQFDETTGTIDKVNRSFLRATEQVRELLTTGNVDFEELSSDLKVLGVEADLSEKDLYDYSNKLLEAQKGGLSAQREVARDYLFAIKEELESLRILDAKSADIAKNISETAIEAEDARQTIIGNSENAKKVPEPVQEGKLEKIDLKGMVQGLSQLAVGITTTINAVGNFLSVFQNFDDASVAEILSACGSAVLSLGAALPSTIEGFKLLKESLGAAFPEAVIITAAIVALGAAIITIVKYFKNFTPEAKFKKAAEAAEELTTAEEEAKEKADNLRAAFDEYTSVKEKLDSCKQGTEEWSEALKEANDAALELLDNLPSNMSADEIKGLYKQENGVLAIDEEKVKEIQKTLDAEVVKASYAADMGNINVQRASNDLTRSNIADDVSKATSHYDLASRATIQQSSAQINKIIEENLKELSSIIEKSEFKERLGELGVQIEYLDDNEIAALQDSLAELAKNTDAVEAKFDVLSRLKVDEILGENYTDAEKNYAAAELSAKEDEFYKNYLGALTNGKMARGADDYKYGNIVKSDNKINNQLLADYNKLTGNNYKSAKNGVIGSDAARFFVFLNEQQEEIKLSAETVAQQMAAAEALERLGDSAEEARINLNKLEQGANEAKLAIEAREKSGDTSGATKEEAQAIALYKAAVGYLANGNMNSLTQEQLQALSGDNSKAIFESLAPELQTYFGEGEEAFTNYQNAIKVSLLNITNAAKNSRIAVQDMYRSLLPNIGDISADTADIIVEALNKSMAEKGEDGMNIVKDIVTGLGENGAEEFKEIYEAIDWTKPNIVELTQRLKDGGYNAGYAATMAEALIDALKNRSKATLEATQTEYAATQKIIDSLDDYDAISSEEIKSLQEIGVATDAYFQELADGTFMLIKDASEFKDIVNGIELGKMQEIITGLQDKYKTLLELSESGSLNVSADSKIQMLQESFGDNEDVQNIIKDYQNAYDINNRAFSDKVIRKNSINVPIAFDGSVGKNLTEGQIKLNNALINLDDVFNTNFTTERINNELEETVAELDKAQEMIQEADFQNNVKEYGLDLKETTKYAKFLAQEMGVSESHAKKLAIANQRLDRGLTDLNENLEDYKKALDKGNKGTAEYSKTMTNVKSVLADVLNVADSDTLSDNFVETTLASENLTKALDGDVEAIQRLQTAAADDIIINIATNHEIEEIPEQIQSRWEALKLAFEGVNLEAPSVEQGKLLTSFNEMIKAGKMTKEEIETALTGLHVAADIKTEYHEEPVTVPTTITDQERYITGYSDVDTNMDGVVDAEVPIWRTVTSTHEGKPKTVMGYVPTYTIDGTTGEGGEVSAFSPAPPMPSASSTTSDGDGSATKASKPKKFTPTKYHKRYTDTKTKLDSVSSSLEKMNSATNDAWGKTKLSNMEKANALIAKQGRLYEKLYREAFAYKIADEKALRESLGADNIEITFNEDGTIKNLEAIQKAWEKELESIDSNKNKILDESEEELYEQTKEHIEEQQDLVEKYIEAVEEMNGAIQDAVNNIREYMNNKLEEIELKIELDIKPLDRDIKELTDTIDVLGEVGLRTGQSLSKSFAIASGTYAKFFSVSEGVDKEIQVIENLRNLNPGTLAYKDAIDMFGSSKAIEEYLKGNGRLPAEYIEKIEDNIDTIYDQIQELYKSLDGIYETYKNMFDTFIKDFDLINAKLDTSANKLELYRKIYEASGIKDTSRKVAEANIATADTNNAIQKYKVAENQRDLLKNELDRREGMLAKYKDKSLEDLTEVEAADYKNIKALIDETEAALEDAEQEVISALENVIDKAVAEAEAKVAVARAEFVESVTEGMFNDFDRLSTYYDDLEEKRKFYLDEYDRDYNLDKFDYQITDYLKDADITSPDRLSAWEEFQERINKLREEGVDLTQEQINKLQAEFELEKLRDQYAEAQNAKTTMRLARDASGNYHYVYSQDKTESPEDIAQKIKDQEKAIRDMGKAIVEEMQDTYLATAKELEEYLAENGGIIDDHAEMLQDRLGRIADQISRQCDETGFDFAEMSLGIISNTDDMAECHQKFLEGFKELSKEEIEANDEKTKTIIENNDNEISSYDNLADEVKEKTKDIIKSDNELADKSKELADDIDNAMDRAAGSVKVYSEQICSYLNNMIEKYKELKGILDVYENGEVTPDKNTDYSIMLYEMWKQSGKGDITQFLWDNEKLVKERMAIAKERGIDVGSNITEVIGNMVKQFIDWDTKGQDFNDNWDYGGSSGYSYSWQKRTVNFGIDKNADKTKSIEVAKALKENRVLTDGQLQELGYTAEEIKNGRYILARADKLEMGIDNVAKGLYGYASGGLANFTGPAWLDGSLSKPEIVLNPEDTKNLLAAVKEIRSSVVLQQLALNSNPSFTGSYSTDRDIQPVLQDVKIDATFPNVSVADEIEEAFEDLINKTSQYVVNK